MLIVTQLVKDILLLWNLKIHNSVGGEFLTAVVVKSYNFWDKTACNSLQYSKSDVSDEYVASIFRAEE
jgi:hypothetical protein